MTALGEVLGLLGELTGEAVGPGTRLDADLRLDSLELATLADRMRRLPGAPDLLAHLAGLDLDHLIAFSAGDLAGLVTA